MKGKLKQFECSVCGKRFATKNAMQQHKRDAHGDAKADNEKPLSGWSSDWVYDFVDDMDLPDGAHWALIEELSGLEPGDFA